MSKRQNPKFYDGDAAIKVIGGIMNDPGLLDSGEYVFKEQDFCNELHRVLFGAIYNMHLEGAQVFNPETIEEYIRKRPKSWSTYSANKGTDWLLQAIDSSEIGNFKLSYDRMKKMTLLRFYDAAGVNTSWIYDPDSFMDINKRQEQEEAIDSLSVKELAELIESKILPIKDNVVDNSFTDSQQAGEGLRELLGALKKNPVQGYPLYDRVLNEVALGARPGTFFLRSAGTGVGKTRSAMADALYLGCAEIYDVEENEWKSAGINIPSVFISVELDYDELQTMAVAFVSGVQEGKIINHFNELDFEELERVKKATKLIEQGAIWFEYMPDYTMRDVENCIKRNIRTRQVNAVFFDYLTSSMSIIEEVARASNGVKIREDQVLFLLASKIKDIAGKYGVFIASSSQLNGLSRTEKILDQNVLAGAKAMANRVDFGSVMVDATAEDLEELDPILKSMPGLDGVPNIKFSVYKNRRGKTTRAILWMKASKGNCRYETMIDKTTGRALVTDFNYELIDITKED